MKARLLPAAALGCAVLALLLSAEVTRSDEDLDAGEGRSTVLSPEAQAAIEKGLAYLASTQNDQGAWINAIGYKLNYDYRKTNEASHVGVTALAGMAFLANGHLPTRGRYARNVQGALDFVLSCVDPESGFITYRQTRMYSHAFAALFLAEIYGMTPRADLKDKLKAIVDLLVHCQNQEGGWRYLPFATDTDISLTVCQLQFLRAARNCGISVPPVTIERATAYVKQCQNGEEDGRAWGPVGSFRYQANVSHGSRSTFALTAAGLTSLNAAGVYNDPMIARGLDFLIRNRPARQSGAQDFHYFYGHYYAIQAFFQAGGGWWERWWGPLQKELVREQGPDGAWSDEVGPHYATAMATLILSVPLEYLPIFQR